MVKICKKVVNITKNKIKFFPKKSVELARPDELAADELARHPCKHLHNFTTYVSFGKTGKKFSRPDWGLFSSFGLFG